MRRILLVLACLLASLCPVPPAVAAAAPTVNGRYQVPYYGTVTITGTTPLPNQRVVIYFRAAGQPSFVARRDLVSGANRAFGTTYTATTTWAYYAHAGGANSPIRTTYLIGARCTLSGPAFRVDPMPVNSSPPDRTVAAFTYTKNGVWYGYAYNALQQFGVITWRPGQRAATVLGRHPLVSGPFALARDGNVRIVGVTRAGAVIAAVNSAANGTRWGFRGFAYIGGRTYKLAGAPSWRSVEPLAVLDSGQIWGVVDTGTAGYLVSWASKRAPYRVLARLVARPSGRDQMNGRGDLVYSHTPDGEYIRYAANGAVRHITDSTGYGAQSAVLYGTTFTGHVDGGWAQWNLAAPSSTPSTPPTRLFADERNSGIVTAVGPNSLFVVHSYDGPPTLRSMDGAYGVLPSMFGDRNQGVGEAIDTSGRVALTLKSDRLIHFVTCH